MAVRSIRLATVDIMAAVAAIGDSWLDTSLARFLVQRSSIPSPASDMTSELVGDMASLANSSVALCDSYRQNGITDGTVDGALFFFCFIFFFLCPRGERD